MYLLQLHMLALCAMVMMVLHQAVAPSPPNSTPEWLERFLAMEWKEASEFSDLLADQGRGHGSGVSFSRQDQRSGGSDSTDLLPSYTGGHPESQPRDMSLSSMAIPSASQLPEQRSLSPPRSSTTQTHDLPDVSVHLYRAVPYTLATLPAVLSLPADFVWLPSQQLMVETLDFFAHIRSDLPASMTRLDVDERAILFQRGSWDYFTPKTKAHAIQLPTQVVFVKFSVQDRFVANNPRPQTMSIWTLENERGQSALGLRGLWGIRSIVQHIFTQSPASVSYTAKGLPFGRIGHALYRQDTPNTIEEGAQTSNHETRT